MRAFLYQVGLNRLLRSCLPRPRIYVAKNQDLIVQKLLGFARYLTQKAADQC